MQIKVLLFAQCADVVGSREKMVELAEGCVLKDLMDALVREHPGLEPIRKSAMVSLNQEYAGGDAALSDGDEVAMIPPVSGGA